MEIIKLKKLNNLHIIVSGNLCIILDFFRILPLGMPKNYEIVMYLNALNWNLLTQYPCLKFEKL